jgi:hypothetical protein
MEFLNTGEIKADSVLLFDRSWKIQRQVGKESSVPFVTISDLSMIFSTP